MAGVQGQQNLLIVLTDGTISWDATHARLDPDRTTALPVEIERAISRNRSTSI